MANTPSHKASIRLLPAPRCPVEATSLCWVPSSKAHSESFQYSPTSPTWENADSASATVLGRQSGASRSPYHSCAKLQPCCSERVPPRGRFHCWHQRSTCCSDRNRSMVRQVKTTSLYQSLGGTAMCMIPSLCRSRPLLTSSIIWKLQHPHAASMRPALCSMAGMPSASQMQLPNQDCSPRRTGKGVGIAENGAILHSSPFS